MEETLVLNLIEQEIAEELEALERQLRELEERWADRQADKGNPSHQ